MDHPPVTLPAATPDELAVGWLYLHILIIWTSALGGLALVRAYLWLDNLPARKPRHRNERTMPTMTVPTTDTPTSRPRPLRTAGAIIGGLTALLSGLVGSGLLTTGQGSALTGIITAVITALSAFGIVASVEQRVTPLTDPRDSAGRPLAPVEPTEHPTA